MSSSGRLSSSRSVPRTLVAAVFCVVCTMSSGVSGEVRVTGEHDAHAIFVDGFESGDTSSR